MGLCSNLKTVAILRQSRPTVLRARASAVAGRVPAQVSQGLGSGLPDGCPGRLPDRSRASRRIGGVGADEVQESHVERLADALVAAGADTGSRAIFLRNDVGILEHAFR